MENKIYFTYTSFLIDLIALINAQGISTEQISLSETEVRDSYQRGQTPEYLYFEVWQQDAGNFFKMWLPMHKITIWFKYHRSTRTRKAHWACGIGDGVHDGTYVKAATKALAALKFIEEYNQDPGFNLTIK